MAGVLPMRTVLRVRKSSFGALSLLSHRDRAFFERLARDFERVARELGEFVERRVRAIPNSQQKVPQPLYLVGSRTR